MDRPAVNSVVGAVFGTVFVVVNAQPLETALALVLRVAAVLVLLVVVVRSRRLRAVDTGRPGPTYGRPYLMVVAAEVVALAVGLVVVGSTLGRHAEVAWVAFVVGVHFFGLAAVWHESRFAVLAVPVAACGVVGLVLAGGDTSAATIAVVSGVVPGAILLAFALHATIARSAVAQGSAVP